MAFAVIGRNESWTRWVSGDNHTDVPHEPEGNPTQEAADMAAYAGGYMRGPTESGPAVGYGIVPWTPEKCMWTRYLIATEYWRQKISIEYTCTCPPRSWIASAGSRSGTTRTQIRRQGTYTDGMSDIFGVGEIPCKVPPM
jgi:hypothetical protein